MREGLGLAHKRIYEIFKLVHREGKLLEEFIENFRTKILET